MAGSLDGVMMENCVTSLKDGTDNQNLSFFKKYFEIQYFLTLWRPNCSLPCDSVKGVARKLSFAGGVSISKFFPLDTVKVKEIIFRKLCFWQCFWGGCLYSLTLPSKYSHGLGDPVSDLSFYVTFATRVNIFLNTQ